MNVYTYVFWIADNLLELAFNGFFVCLSANQIIILTRNNE